LFSIFTVKSTFGLLKVVVVVVLLLKFDDDSVSGLDDDDDIISVSFGSIGDSGADEIPLLFGLILFDLPPLLLLLLLLLLGLFIGMGGDVAVLIDC